VFSGTSGSPETLVVDSAGSRSPVEVRFSITAASIPIQNTCGQINFDQFNAGVILARGDLVLTGDAVFSGFIYTTGTVKTQGSVTIRGGVFAANLQGQFSAVNSITYTGTVNFCPGGGRGLPLGPQFYNLSTLSWQEVPLGQP